MRRQGYVTGITVQSTKSLFRKLLLVDSQIAATRVVAGDML